MNILLTGGSGFLGNKLLKELLKSGHHIYLTVHKHNYDKEMDFTNISCINLSNENWDKCFPNITFDVAIHCAVSYSKDIITAFECNVFFAERVLNFALNHRCKLFINTDSFYCKQLNDYSHTSGIFRAEYTLSKFAFKEHAKAMAVQNKNFTFVNMMLEHMYGKDDSPNKFIPMIEEKLKSGEKILLTNGEQVRDFVDVQDVVNTYIRLINTEINGGGYYEYDIGYANPCTIREFIIRLKGKLNSKSELAFGAIPYSPFEIMYSSAEEDCRKLFIKTSSPE